MGCYIEKKRGITSIMSELQLDARFFSAVLPLFHTVTVPVTQGTFALDPTDREVHGPKLSFQF